MKVVLLVIERKIDWCPKIVVFFFFFLFEISLCDRRVIVNVSL